MHGFSSLSTFPDGLRDPVIPFPQRQLKLWSEWLSSPQLLCLISLLPRDILPLQQKGGRQEHFISLPGEIPGIDALMQHLLFLPASLVGGGDSAG